MSPSPTPPPPPPYPPPPGTSPAAQPNPPTSPSNVQAQVRDHHSAVPDPEQEGRSEPLPRQDKTGGDGAEDSPGNGAAPAASMKEAAAAGVNAHQQDSRSKGKEICHDGGSFCSYRDALLKPRTFKPRFPAGEHHGQQRWLTAHSMGRPRSTSSVWSRLGAAGGHHGRPERKLPPCNGASLVETLRAKAGARCFNCLSSGHFIASCRDPPRCIHCLRFGHKARRCPYPPRSFASPRPAATSTAAATPRPRTTAPTTPRTTATSHAQPTAATGAPAANPSSLRASAGSRRAAPAAREPPTRPALRDMEEYHPHHIPGAPEMRPERVRAGVARSEAVRQAERDLEIYALLAVPLDARVRLDTALVREQLVRQLRIPIHELGVSRVAGSTFLLRFDNQQQRNTTYRRGEFQIGHVKFHLMQWRREFSATGSTQFLYRVRVCIEGVPYHLRNAEAVSGLFKPPTLIDDEICPVKKPEEEECVRLWLWTTNPNGIATIGTLHVEDPVTLQEEGYADSLMDLGMPRDALRHGPASATDYEVLIHVDRVLDYSNPPVSPTRGSPDSDISGIPGDEDEAWPAQHPQPWTLGVPDGGRRQPERRRGSVHDRLGDRGRDRSPPRGGGAGGFGAGLGLRQIPPSGPHDLGHRGTRSGFQHGSSSRGAGGNYRCRDGEAQQRQLVWQPKKVVPAVQLCTDHTGETVTGKTTKVGLVKDSTSKGLKQQMTVDSFHFGESLQQLQREQDPMMEEAEHRTTDRCILRPTAIEDEDVSDHPARTEHARRADGSLDLLAQADTVRVSLCCETMEGRQIQIQEVEGTVEQMTKMPEDELKIGPLPSLLGLTLDGPTFDLNQEAHDAQQCLTTHPAVADQLFTSKSRPVLEIADDRLNKKPEQDDRQNKNAKEGAHSKVAPKTVARFVVPLRKALLCNPPARVKAQHAKKVAQPTTVGEKNKGSKAAVKRYNMTVEDQASLLLMTATGVIEENGTLTEDAEQTFSEQFIDPMNADPVTDIRIALGLPGLGRTDVLAALAAENNVADD
ncbi:unnamed protein product [Urochloa humidicola]